MFWAGLGDGRARRRELRSHRCGWWARGSAGPALTGPGPAGEAAPATMAGNDASVEAQSGGDGPWFRARELTEYI